MSEYLAHFSPRVCVCLPFLFLCNRFLVCPPLFIIIFTALSSPLFFGDSELRLQRLLDVSFRLCVFFFGLLSVSRVSQSFRVLFSLPLPRLLCFSLLGISLRKKSFFLSVVVFIWGREDSAQPFLIFVSPRLFALSHSLLSVCFFWSYLQRASY